MYYTLAERQWHYLFGVTPVTLTLPDDLSDDPPPFVANFQRTFAPGEDSGTNPFVTFTVGPNAAPGTYNVAFELQDAANTGLAQQAFTLNVAAVPEPALVAAFPALLALGGLCCAAIPAETGSGDRMRN